MDAYIISVFSRGKLVGNSSRLDELGSTGLLYTFSAGCFFPRILRMLVFRPDTRRTFFVRLYKYWYPSFVSDPISPGRAALVSRVIDRNTIRGYLCVLSG